MNLDSQIQEYADKLKCPDISARVKKRILQKLGKLKKQVADKKTSATIPDVSVAVGSNSDGSDGSDSENEANPKEQLDSSHPSKKKARMGNSSSEHGKTDTYSATTANNGKMGKKERKNLLHLLNKDLANFAVKKQADKAKFSVKQLMKKGVQLDTLAYTNLINVYVRCNEISRVVAVVKEMKEECVPLNIVTYTTVLKGYSENGMVKEARELFNEMVSTNQYNARSITTYLRGCIRTGTVSYAVDAYKRLRELKQSARSETKHDSASNEGDKSSISEGDIDVLQESSCLEYVVKLLCQAGRAMEASELINSHIDFMAKAGHQVTEGSAIANAGLYYILARASVLLGQWSDASKYSNLALELLEIEDKANLTQSMKRRFAETFYQENADGDDDLQFNPSSDPLDTKSIRLFRQHRRAELRNGLELLKDYLSAVPEPDRLSVNAISSLIRETVPAANKTAVIAIASYHVILSKLFNFGFDGVGDIGKSIDTGDMDSLVSNLLQGHKSKFGMISPQIKALIANLLQQVQESKRNHIDDSSDEENSDSDEEGPLQFPGNLINSRTIKSFNRKLEDYFMSKILRTFSSPFPASSNSGFINLRRLFYQDDDIDAMIEAGIRDDIPVKLEIGSGNGDWIVAQAEADRVIERFNHSQPQHLSYSAKQQMYRHKKQEGRDSVVSSSTVAINATSLRVAGHWVALELRCDRVYNILANHLLTLRPLNYLAQHHADMNDLYHANNLAILGGDAVQIVNQRIPRNSISEIFINYPQPPERVTGGGKSGNKNQGKHLLTKEFFYQLLQILKEQGSITLLTDNLLYAQNLSQSLVELAENSGTKKPLLLDAVDASFGEAQNDGLWKIQENFPVKLKKDNADIKKNITIWRGEPGKNAGHVTNASSYFDRMWAMGQKKRRWFLFLRKQVVTPSLSGLVNPASADANPILSQPQANRLDAEGEDEFMVADDDDEDN